MTFTREGEPTCQVDFDVYRHGAAAMASGLPLDVHDFLVSSSRIAMPFTYPPLAAELLMPITRVSYRPAALLWMGASVLALVANVHVVARSLGLRPGLSAVLAVVCG